MEDPYLLSQLLDIEDSIDDYDEVIKGEIEETYGIGTNIEEIFKHFQNIPKDIKIDFIRIDQDIEEEEDITPTFEVKQILLVPSNDGDTYMIYLPINIDGDED